MAHDGISIDSDKEDVEAKTEAPVAAHPQDEETKYPSFKKVLVIMVALYLAVFLIALDRTIIATAIPRITDDFRSINDIGWYGSSYLITGSAFQLIYGKVYTFYSPKWVFIGAIVLFEVGSAVCGAAPNSIAFIIGRAIAGLGSGGIMSGGIIIIACCVPLHKRPLYTGFLGAIFGIASIIAPLLGGAFTDRVTWRWCFYINLPIGAVTLVITVLILHLETPKKSDADLSLKRQIVRLDPLGSTCFLPSMLCLFLALQWGGTEYAWSSGRVVATLVVFAVLLVLFIGIQIWQKEDATVPPRLFLQRSMLSGSLFILCLSGAMIVTIYFLPVWFQAIKGVSALKSGLMSLPLVLSLVVASIITGTMVSNLGYYVPPMIGCSIIMSIGSGFLTTITTDTGHQKWIGYQVIFGFGLGMGMQQAAVAAQTVLAKRDVPIGASLMFFFQTLGGAVFLAVAQNIFSNKLVEGLEEVSTIQPSAIVNAGATELRNLVTDPAALQQVLAAYNSAVVGALRVALGLACATILGAAFMEWRSVKNASVGH